jgi:hypothetical protein
MFLAIAMVLVLIWVLGFLAFHVAGGLIHLLIVVALISFIVHFIRGGRPTQLRIPSDTERR